MKINFIDEYGTRKPFYYFLTPSYWTGKQSKTDTKEFKEKMYTNKKDEEYPLPPPMMTIQVKRATAQDEAK